MAVSPSAARRLLDRLPLWSFFPLGLLLLFAGLAIIGVSVQMPEGESPKAAAMRMAPLWVLVLVPLAEAMAWTVAPTEVCARWLRAAWFGAVFGVLAYALYHAPEGGLGIATSAWMGIVLACLYLAMRERSRRAAILNTICIRWTFTAYAYVALAGLGG